MKRAAILREIRSFLGQRGYVEVETPMMQAIPGGAAAQPFKTHHNALGCDFYMRIALELPLKRMLVGGVDKVFEIGRVFRNEGLSRKHNPEFTMLEAYQAYGDYESMMELVQGMVCQVAQAIHRTLKVPKGFNIDKGRADISSLFKTMDRDFLPQLSNELIKSSLSNDELQKAQPEIKSAFQPVNELFKNLRTEIDKAIRPEFWEVAEQISTALDALFQRISALVQQFPNRYDENGRRLSDLKMHNIMLKNFSKLQIIDLTPPWRRVKYKDLIRERIPTWFDWTPQERLYYAEDFLEVQVMGRPLRKLEQTDTRQRELLNRIQSYLAKGIPFSELPASDQNAVSEANEEFARRAKDVGEGIVDFEIDQAVFEKWIEPTLIQPTFVTHAPKELLPLAKLSPDDPTTVEVFECCINGQEIAPAYTEQNDPIAQRERLEHQAGGEQQKLDEDFLVALEHGMPPAGGMGMGIDRLCMMLLGQESIRDVILFPQLKPK